MIQRLQTFHALLAAASLLFCACQTRHEYPAELLHADSLTIVDAQKALAVLKTMDTKMQGACEADRRYYELLTIKAADKANVNHTSDSLIMRLVDYYTQHVDKRLTPEAFYYAGRVCKELGDAPRALGYFQKTIATADDEENLYTQSLAYAQAAYLLREQYLYEAAMRMHKKELECDLALDAPKKIIYSLRDVGTCYRSLEKDDSAVPYLNRALEMARAYHMDDMEALVQIQRAYTFRKLNRMEQAMDCLRKALAYNHPQDQMALFSIAADCYQKAGMPDSAEYFLKKEIELDNSIAKEEGNLRLAELYMDNGQNEKAIPHMQTYISSYDSATTEKARMDVAKMDALFNYDAHERKSTELVDSNRRMTWNMLLLLGLCAIVTIASLLAFRRIFWMKRSFREQSQELQGTIDEIRSKQTKTEDNNRKKNDEFIGRIKLMAANGNNTTPMTDYDWNQLMEIVENMHPGFVQRLINTFGTMTQQDFRTCLLVRAGMSVREIATLTFRSPDAIYKAAARTYVRYFHRNGSYTDWAREIKNL